MAIVCKRVNVDRSSFLALVPQLHILKLLTKLSHRWDQKFMASAKFRPKLKPTGEWNNEFTRILYNLWDKNNHHLLFVNKISSSFNLLVQTWCRSFEGQMGELECICVEYKMCSCTFVCQVYLRDFPISHFQFLVRNTWIHKKQNLLIATEYWIVYIKNNKGINQNWFELPEFFRSTVMKI